MLFNSLGLQSLKKGNIKWILVVEVGYHVEPLSLEHPEGLAQKTIHNNATSTENNRTAWWPGTMKLEALTRCVVPNWSQMMPSSTWPIFYWFEWQVTSITSWVNLLFTKQKQEITYCDSFSICFLQPNFFFVWGVTHFVRENNWSQTSTTLNST